MRAGLLRAVDVLTDSVTERSAYPSLNGDQGVHLVRTTIKRLRALLRLIRPAVNPVFFNNENARLKSAAGLLFFARDAGVARGTLKNYRFRTKAMKTPCDLFSLDLRNKLSSQMILTLPWLRSDVVSNKPGRNFHRLKLRGTERRYSSPVRAISTGS